MTSPTTTSPVDVLYSNSSLQQSKLNSELVNACQTSEASSADHPIETVPESAHKVVSESRDGYLLSLGGRAVRRKFNRGPQQIVLPLAASTPRQRMSFPLSPSESFRNVTSNPLIHSCYIPAEEIEGGHLRFVGFISLKLLAKISERELLGMDWEAISSHRSLEHSNILKFFRITIRNRFAALVLEEYQCSLRNLLEDTTVFLSWQRRAQFVHDIADGLGYLHSKSLFLRDLRSKNIFLGRKGQAKLVYFIPAEKFSSLQSSSFSATSPAWTAPEILRDQENSMCSICSVFSDTYALGVTIWEVCSRSEPFAGKGYENETFSSWICNGIRPPRLANDIPDVFVKVIGNKFKGCLAASPMQRCDIPYIFYQLKTFMNCQPSEENACKPKPLFGLGFELESRLVIVLVILLVFFFSLSSISFFVCYTFLLWL